jgi:CRISPR-associated endonuclease/helicase Cas3
MSLDLSADLLVTDLAPISALIQRLGRLNRRATPENPLSPKPFLIVEPNSEAPYKTQENPSPFTPARLWLERLGAAPLSQAKLAQMWISLDEKQDLAPLESAWLDGGFKTTPSPLRESAPGLTILLPDDAVVVERGEIDPVRVRIPMNPPKDKNWKTWRQIAFAHVPPSECITYDPRRGAQWKN